MILNTVKKYLRIYRALFVASLKSNLEYRLNFFMEMSVDFFWFLSLLVIFETIGHITTTTNGWDLPHYRFFMGLVLLNDAIFSSLCFLNFEYFQSRVIQGQLDMILSKPVDSQFMVALEKVSIPQIGSTLFGFCWLFWSASQIENFSYLKMLWLIVVLPMSILIHANFRFLFASFTVIYVKTDSLMLSWYQMYRLAQRPDFLFGKFLQLLFRTILPLSLLSSLPAAIIFEDQPVYYVIWTIIVTLIFTFCVRKFWLYSLKKYSSASS